MIILIGFVIFHFTLFCCFKLMRCTFIVFFYSIYTLQRLSYPYIWIFLFDGEVGIQNKRKISKPSQAKCNWKISAKRSEHKKNQFRMKWKLTIYGCHVVQKKKKNKKWNFKRIQMVFSFIRVSFNSNLIGKQWLMQFYNRIGFIRIFNCGFLEDVFNFFFQCFLCFFP